MRLSSWNSYSLFAALFLSISIIYHNCGTSDITFSQDNLSSLSGSLQSEAAGGSGEGFFGKPEEFVRTFPNYVCPSEPLGLQGTLATDSDSIDVKSDHCQPSMMTFALNSKIIDFSEYNRDYLGVGAAIYESTKVSNEPFITEAWCSRKNSSEGVDAVIKVGNNLHDSKAKIYLGVNQNGSWNARRVPLFSVTREENPSTLTYSGTSGFRLILSKPATSSLLTTGILLLSVDDKAQKLDVTCRLANRANIEEMGTGITALSALNAFTTDQQEATCNHASAGMCDNFENRTVGAIPPGGSPNPIIGLPKFKLPNGWQTTSGDGSISTAQFIDGNKSLDVLMPAGSRWAFGIFSTSVGLPIPRYFWRFYIKFSANYKWSGVSDLHFTDYAAVSYMLKASTNSLLVNTNQGPLGIVNQEINMGSMPSLGQWHCLEFAAARNTNGTTAPNGSVEAWIDNRKVVNLTNINLTPANNQFHDFGINHYWRCVGGAAEGVDVTCPDSVNPANQHPAQSISYDNWVVSTQRVGCF